MLTKLNLYTQEADAHKSAATERRSQIAQRAVRYALYFTLLALLVRYSLYLLLSVKEKVADRAARSQVRTLLALLVQKYKY
jgi:hypothetical protein